MRASAVLAPLYEEDGSVFVVLTRRAQHLRSHHGEVSFPGGGQDPGESLLDTARREAYEEIAMDPSTIEIIGELARRMGHSKPSMSKDVYANHRDPGETETAELLSRCGPGVVSGR